MIARVASTFYSTIVSALLAEIRQGEQGPPVDDGKIAASAFEENLGKAYQRFAAIADSVEQQTAGVIAVSPHFRRIVCELHEAPVVEVEPITHIKRLVTATPPSSPLLSCTTDTKVAADAKTAEFSEEGFGKGDDLSTKVKEIIHINHSR